MDTTGRVQVRWKDAIHVIANIAIPSTIGLVSKRASVCCTENGATLGFY
jgi:hypothetical protein